MNFSDYDSCRFCNRKLWSKTHHTLADFLARECQVLITDKKSRLMCGGRGGGEGEGGKGPDKPATNSELVGEEMKHV